MRTSAGSYLCDLERLTLEGAMYPEVGRLYAQCLSQAGTAAKANGVLIVHRSADAKVPANILAQKPSTIRFAQRFSCLTMGTLIHCTPPLVDVRVRGRPAHPESK